MPSVCNAIMVVCLLDEQLPLPSVPITTNVVSSIPAEGEMYSLQQYMIHVVSDNLRVRIMLFNATFNNISAKSRRSDLLAEETEVP
jgi:hypothetical protein